MSRWRPDLGTKNALKQWLQDDVSQGEPFGQNP
jgi:hypothetical protein